jgi:hypothetical protein
MHRKQFSCIRAAKHILLHASLHTVHTQATSDMVCNDAGYLCHCCDARAQKMFENVTAAQLLLLQDTV